MPLPHYAYSYKRYKRMKRIESVKRLFSVFITKKYIEDVDKHSRQEEELQRKVFGKQAAPAQED